MNTRTLLLWLPRIMGLALITLTVFFAMDATDSSTSLSERFSNVGIHLIPAVILLAVVIFSWKHALGGGIFFILLAVVYAFIARDRADWILVISLPLFITGVAFIGSYLAARKAS